jgi:hypothetical protein
VRSAGGVKGGEAGELASAPLTPPSTSRPSPPGSLSRANDTLGLRDVCAAGVGPFWRAQVGPFPIALKRMSSIRALAYFGAVPEILVPDQLRSAVLGPASPRSGAEPDLCRDGGALRTVVIPALPPRRTTAVVVLAPANQLVGDGRSVQWRLDGDAI